MPLCQQRLASQAEALEAAIRMEASPIGESSTGMAEVQSQLVALTLQLQDISKQKEKREDVRCTYYRTEGNYKNQCLVLLLYMATGAPNHVGPGEGTWCELCRTRGHRPANYHLLQKYVNLTKSLYCKFCQFVGYEQSDCRSWIMMNDRNAGLYRIQGEEIPEASTLQFPEPRGGYGGYKGRERGYSGQGRGPIICYNCSQQGHLT